MAGSLSAAASLLRRQLKEMQVSKDIPGISCGLVSDSNIFEWEVMLMISDDCKYYGGMFSASTASASALHALSRALFPSPMLTHHHQVVTFERASRSRPTTRTCRRP